MLPLDFNLLMSGTIEQLPCNSLKVIVENSDSKERVPLLTSVSHLTIRLRPGPTTHWVSADPTRYRNRA